jgi:glycosyltransferase involved in cell wall biosynthesis
VVTDVGAGEYVVGETGWVVPARDSDRLGDAIGEAFAEVADAAAWARRRTAARDRAVAEFGVDRMVRGYQRVWRGDVSC